MVVLIGLLEVVVQSVNFIKARPLKARQHLFVVRLKRIFAMNEEENTTMYCFIVMQGGFPKAKFFCMCMT